MWRFRPTGLPFQAMQQASFGCISPGPPGTRPQRENPCWQWKRIAGQLVVSFGCELVGLASFCTKDRYQLKARQQGIAILTCMNSDGT